MIERTTFDLRLAEHRAITARIEASGWQRQHGGDGRAGRTAVPAMIAALGARLSLAAHAATRVTHRQPDPDAA